jgi:hypothetical protein
MRELPAFSPFTLHVLREKLLTPWPCFPKVTYKNRTAQPKEEGRMMRKLFDYLP